MSAAHSHELAAFRRDLHPSMRLAAEQAFVLCSDLRGLLTGIAALGILASADPGHVPTATVVVIADRLRDIRRRLVVLDGLDHAGLDSMLAATADLQRAIERVAAVGSVRHVAPWAALTDCYAAMEQLRRDLWAFELRPEGAPISPAARSRYDEGFASLRADAG